MNYELTAENARLLWAQLGDIPIFTEDEEGDCPESIALPFLHFPVGTPREDIWHWFEEVFPVTVHELMYGGPASKTRMP